MEDSQLIDILSLLLRRLSFVISYTIEFDIVEALMLV